ETPREDLPLHAAVEHVPAVLHDVDAPEGHAGLQLLQPEVRHADVAGLALADGLVARPHGFVEWRDDLWPVQQIDVDVMRPEILQAVVEGGRQAPARAVAAVGGVRVADAALGDHDDALPPLAERLGQRALRDTHAIRLGGVEAIDAV